MKTTQDETSTLNARLVHIESLLEQVLSELRRRRRTNGKRTRTVAHNAYVAAANDNDNRATELEIAHARRVLLKRSRGK